MEPSKKHNKQVAKLGNGDSDNPPPAVIQS